MKASTKLERVPVKPAITWLKSPGQIISEFLHSSSLFHNLDLCTIWSWRTYLWFDRLPASGWNRTQLHPLDSSSRRSLLVASPSPSRNGYSLFSGTCCGSISKARWVLMILGLSCSSTTFKDSIWTCFLDSWILESKVKGTNDFQQTWRSHYSGRQIDLLSALIIPRMEPGAKNNVWWKLDSWNSWSKNLEKLEFLKFTAHPLLKGCCFGSLEVNIVHYIPDHFLNK